VQAFQFLVADTGVYDSHTPPPAAATESSVRRLSVPYTLGGTVTARAIPSAASIPRYATRLPSGGVKLRLGVKGYCSTGCPKMCAWQSQASDVSNGSACTRRSSAPGRTESNFLPPAHS
jgi:hypothetical protein